MNSIRTRVAIVGAGPAGLVLGHLLDRAGIDNVVFERRGREYLEQRVRAGVIEWGVANFLESSGVGARLRAEGLVHHGVEIRVDELRHRVALSELYEGRPITVYGQTQLVRDLIALRLAAGSPLLFESPVEHLDGLAGDECLLRARAADGEFEVRAEYVIGCDGGKAVSSSFAPAGAFRRAERLYPYAWLGILAEAPPATEELIYCRHERGFALYSMRSPTISRLYLGVGTESSLSDWSDERIWDELARRLTIGGVTDLAVGPIVERSLTTMRSVVTYPMRFGRLLLAGDAAHIVPPTGAKGMNGALADVRVLAPALVSALTQGDESGLEAYSATCLERVWRAEEFSYYLTQMLHPSDDEFENGVQLARLRGLLSSEGPTRSFARNYVNLSSL